MDRRSEMLLRRAWDTNAVAMAPALASACVARNLYAWLHKLTDHVARETRSKEVIDSLLVRWWGIWQMRQLQPLEPQLIQWLFSTLQEGPFGSSHGRRTTCPDSVFAGCLLRAPCFFGPSLDQVLLRFADKKEKS